MTAYQERLLAFPFFGILLTLLYHAIADRLVHHFFPDSLALQAIWYLPYIAAPSLLLLGLAWKLGFYRRGESRWADLAATIMLAAIVVLTLEAPYSCWVGITVKCYE